MALAVMKTKRRDAANNNTRSTIALKILSIESG